jgi:opacity protein-like surface antigen
MNKIFLTIVFALIVFISFSQDTSKVKKQTVEKHKVFANIFTAAYYNFNTIKPNAGFDVSTALLGYQYKKNETLKFTLIYDVTRTTTGITVTDTSGNQLPVYYFDGSKYTAFLKMAEVKWNFAKNFSLSTGQLLNQQYLTVQDRFWAHRYVAVTMQELYRMAYPADFGMRVEYKDKNKFAFSIGAVNGNGPFYKQDKESLIEYNSNLEIYYIKNLLIKTFVSLTPSTYDTEKDLKTAFSGFVAYKLNKFKIGAEYSYTDNVKLTSVDYSGFSIFSMYELTDKWEIFGRYDYVDNSSVVKINNTYIAGVQFQPEKNFFMSINYRFWSSTEVQQLYFNVGVKF